MGAVLIGALCVLGIHQKIGLEWESGGLALTSLVGIGVGVYLASGKLLKVDPVSLRVWSAWRLLGMIVWQSEFRIAVERVELYPEWMLRNSAMNQSLVYDLVLVGSEATLALKEDLVSFGQAERRARAVGADLGLPVAIRWDRLYEDLPSEGCEIGDWWEPFAYPPALRDWRRWL